MGQIRFIDRLPNDVRNQFNEILVCKNFKDYAFFSFWLKDKGYTASKSAIHRYVTQNKEELLSAERSDSMAIAEMRLRAFELSAAINQNADTEAIKTGADEILNWVFRR